MSNICYSRLYCRLLLLLALLLLTACAGTPQSDALYESNNALRYSATELTDVVFYPQQRYQCGPAALATVLNDSGIEILPEQLTPLIYLPKKKGSLQIELLAATRRLGRMPYLIKPQLSHILDEVSNGRPVLVFQNLGLDWYPQWHYAVIVGFDLDKDELILRSGEQKRHRVSVALFERTWARAEYWAMRVLKPGEFPQHVDELRYLETLVSLERLKNWPLLIKFYRHASINWPQNQSFKMGLANSYYSSNQLQLAKKRYLEIIQLWPNYAPAYNNLAQVYLDSNLINEALKYAQYAVSLAGRYRKTYIKTLSEVQNKLDN